MWTLIDTKTGYHSGVNDGWEKRHFYKPEKKSPVELYDMKNDIRQRKKLATEYPKIVKELQTIIKKSANKATYSVPYYR